MPEAQSETKKGQRPLKNPNSQIWPKCCFSEKGFKRLVLEIDVLKLLEGEALRGGWRGS
jgi:hypothetical protein